MATVDVSGFDTNITYLNLQQIGLADTENTPCIAKIEYPSPLIGRVDGYMASVNRFSIPTHTLFMNDRVKSAIVLYTNDNVVLEEEKEYHVVPLDVNTLRDDPGYVLTIK